MFSSCLSFHTTLGDGFLYDRTSFVDDRAILLEDVNRVVWKWPFAFSPSFPVAAMTNTAWRKQQQQRNSANKRQFDIITEIRSPSIYTRTFWRKRKKNTIKLKSCFGSRNNDAGLGFRRCGQSSLRSPIKKTRFCYANRFNWWINQSTHAFQFDLTVTGQYQFRWTSIFLWLTDDLI